MHDNNTNDKFENIIQSDPTLRYFLRETSFDYNNLNNQINLRCSAIKIAIKKYIDDLVK